MADQRLRRSGYYYPTCRWEPEIYAQAVLAVRRRMEREGLSVRTFLDEVRSIKCCEIILPTSAGREIELQCVARPDQAQRILLDRLGLTIPSRLSRPKWRGLAKTDSSCSIDS